MSAEGPCPNCHEVVAFSLQTSVKKAPEPAPSEESDNNRRFENRRFRPASKPSKTGPRLYSKLSDWT
ncbi:MAG: hypothetical protein AAGC74_13625 [Verrucomicrobiota bacterium]